MQTIIYKIESAATWAAARELGTYRGSADDRRDGFVHLSAAGQVRATADRHFAGRAGLIIAAIDAGRLDDKLAWEASRGGALFPHLYGPLPMAAVVWTRDLPLGPDGRHVLPEEVT